MSEDTASGISKEQLETVWQHVPLAIGFTLTDEHFRGVRITKMDWAWNIGKRKKQGFWVDGGIFPWLRFVRHATLDDYRLV